MIPMIFCEHDSDGTVDYEYKNHQIMTVTTVTDSDQWDTNSSNHSKNDISFNSDISIRDSIHDTTYIDIDIDTDCWYHNAVDYSITMDDNDNDEVENRSQALKASFRNIEEAQRTANTMRCAVSQLSPRKSRLRHMHDSFHSGETDQLSYTLVSRERNDCTFSDDDSIHLEETRWMNRYCPSFVFNETNDLGLSFSSMEPDSPCCGISYSNFLHDESEYGISPKSHGLSSKRKAIAREWFDPLDDDLSINSSLHSESLSCFSYDSLDSNATSTIRTDHENHCTGRGTSCSSNQHTWYAQLSSNIDGVYYYQPCTGALSRETPNSYLDTSLVRRQAEEQSRIRFGSVLPVSDSSYRKQRLDWNVSFHTWRSICGEDTFRDFEPSLFITNATQCHRHQTRSRRRMWNRLRTITYGTYLVTLVSASLFMFPLKNFIFYFSAGGTFQPNQDISDSKDIVDWSSFLDSNAIELSPNIGPSKFVPLKLNQSCREHQTRSSVQGIAETSNSVVGLLSVYDSDINKIRMTS